MYHGARVDMWYGLLRDGPTALLDTTLDQLMPGLSDVDRAILRRLLDGLRDQTKWIAEARQNLVGEAARVRELGASMKLAGLRSYTDKDGRIYVIAE